VDTLNLLAPVVGDAAQPVGHGDALDDQRLVFEDDLADRLDLEVLPTHADLTRFQRAGKGARQSPARGRDHVVQRRGARRKVVGAVRQKTRAAYKRNPDVCLSGRGLPFDTQWRRRESNPRPQSRGRQRLRA
jgi:hypothetical protein